MNDISIENNVKRHHRATTLSVILLDVCMLFFVLGTDSLWTLSWENRGLYNIVNVAILVIAVIGIIYIYRNSSRINLSKLKIVVAIFIGITISMICNKELSYGFIQKIAFAFIGVALSLFIDFKYFAKSFVKVMMFLAIWSLVLYALSILGWHTFLPIIKSTTGISYYTGIFSFMPVNSGSILRNWGVFWEPGAYQAYLCLALILDLFYLKNRKAKHLLIFAITIVTTLSTTGVICLGIILLVYLFTRKGRRYQRNKIIIVVCGIIACITVLSYDPLRNMLFDKLNIFDKSMNENASLGARVYSILGNIRIMFTDGFMVGTGITGYNDIYRQVVTSMGYTIDMSNTNTILMDFARFGWIVGIVNTYLICKFIYRLGENFLQRIGIGLVILILLSSECFEHSLFWMTILYFGVDFRRKKYMCKKNIKSTFAR